ncbi:hypothetical protein CPC08DRAFT_820066 [Agrocybe pediades]|nr:hypothetical protein CPC08DRAFT_820066 [Agrocybe pediades]
MSLPPELLDMIIDETSRIPNKARRTKALVALSLVSRSFRERAHNHLFASINMNFGRGAEGAIMDALRWLLDLMEADPNTTTSGLASRITSFACSPPCSVGDPLPGILNKLFLGRGKACTLYISFTSPASWSSLSEDVAQELFNICHRPRLAFLSLWNLRKIPRNFLQHSFIKRLSLNNVSVSKSRLKDSFFAGISDQGHRGAVILESLHFCGEDPILASLLTTSRREMEPEVIFSQVQELFLYFLSPQIDPKFSVGEILTRCNGNLETLKMSLDGRHPNPRTALPFHRFPALHTFEITAINCRSYRPLCDIAIILEQIAYHPNLQNIELHLMHPLNGPMQNVDAIRVSLEGLGCEALDDLFEKPRFACVRSLSLKFFFKLDHEEEFAGPWTSADYKFLILWRFPVLSRRWDISLTVDVELDFA